MATLLPIKQRLVGTAAERPLERVRRLARLPERLRRPELSGLFDEPRYIEIALDHLLQPDWNCVDGGAHVGSFLARFERRCPNGRHLAIEAVPAKAAWLARHFRDAEVQPVALGDVSGEVTFYEDTARSGYSGLHPLDGGLGTVSYSVPGRTLDELAGDRLFQFLKLDLEGGELPALRGAVRLLDRTHPKMLLECGVQRQLDAFGYERTDLWDFLHARDYDVYLTRDYVFGRDPMGRDEFRRSGTYPFPGFNYVALPAGTPTSRLC